MKFRINNFEKHFLPIAPLLLLLLTFTISLIKYWNGIGMQLFLLGMTCFLSLLPIRKLLLHTPLTLAKSERIYFLSKFFLLILAISGICSNVPSSGIATPLGMLEPYGCLLIIYFLTFFAYTMFMNIKAPELETSMGYCFLVSGGLTILSMIYAKGYGAFIHKESKSLSDFAYTFDVWIRYPIAKHLLLIFEQEQGGIDKNLAYHGYSTLYNLMHYIPVKLLHNLARMNPSEIDRFMPVLYAIAYSFLYPLISIRLLGGWLTKTLAGWLLMLGILLMIISHPILWDYTPPAQPAPLLSFWCIALVSLIYRESIGPKWVIFLTASLFGLQLSFVAVIFSIVLAIPISIDLERRILLIQTAAVLIVSGLFAFILQHKIGTWGGYQFFGSSWEHRSGLDGVADFGNVFDSIFAPHHRAGIRVETLFWPACWLIMFLTIIAISMKAPTRIFLGFFLLIGNYLTNAAFIAQAVDWHPNSFDVMLAIPAFFSVLFVLSPESFKNSKLFLTVPWLFLFILTILNHNFVMISRLLSQAGTLQ